MASSASDPASAKGKAVCEFAAQRKPRILLAACGCVTAVKFGYICSCFSCWAEVKAVVTRASMRFMGRLSMPLGVPVYTDDHDWGTWKKLGDGMLHIELSRWADIMVIAPLSANTLGKIEAGLCDNLLTCIVRAWDYSKPFFVAPSMNHLMWENCFTEKQVMSIDELGISLIPPVITRSACGKQADCAMAEPSTIYSTVRLFYEIHVLKKAPGMV
ncbi:hypothetical protein TanjilG_24908 [Lupinus angustifolius]|uniref:phosphopantothenoylcysteine decarboxylase n=1 Tax=Lupinus angustifolius TaxID=3871 RepID=A0A4P1QZY4_LUPAN|nr:PREDICTED: probable phosphopantothenoylcysteine decarboxylase [Lupinus angustifolius]OIV98737.1 hypothetical protein TanjilG_24908 [Lupinus angustifolius]